MRRESARADVGEVRNFSVAFWENANRRIHLHALCFARKVVRTNVICWFTQLPQHLARLPPSGALCVRCLISSTLSQTRLGNSDDIMNNKVKLTGLTRIISEPHSSEIDSRRGAIMPLSATV
jgi:hypothetical protein